MHEADDGTGHGGHSDVVEMLRQHFERVKADPKIGFAAIMTCDGPSGIITDHVGTFEGRFPAIVGCETLKRRLIDEVENRQVPEADPNIPANLVCYDLNVEPANYDFPCWLAYAEMARVREKAPAPLQVAFLEAVPGGEPPHVTQRRTTMFRNVLLPIVKMMGAEHTENVLGRRYNTYALRPIVEAYNRGEDVPEIKSGLKLPLDRAPVTITLREADQWPHRNSNIEAWVRFARRLRVSGQLVVFVRDTAKADEPLEDFDTMPEASRDLYTRMALYEAAKCNLFVSNGPWVPALFGKNPWLLFNKVSASDPYHANMPKWWQNNHGIKEGDQFPWCAPDQRIIWTEDSYEAICGAWEHQLKLWQRMRLAC